MRMAQVTVLIDGATARRRQRYGLNAFESYMTEILKHAGIPYTVIDHIGEVAVSRPDVLVAALADDTEAEAQRLFDYVEQGGTLIAYGGLPKLARRLDSVRATRWETGYATVPESYGRFPTLRALEIHPWTVADAASRGVAESGSVSFREPGAAQVAPLIQSFAAGAGRIHRFSVNVPLCVVGFQQGHEPVVADGLPAPDGSAAVDEGILKADDVHRMDWTLDRRQTASGQSYFAEPYADLWREVAIGHLLQTVVELELTLPFTAYWPEGIEAVATISHDSDGNLDEQAVRTLELLEALQLRSTWCMLEPGYSSGIYERVLGEGHELAFHYNALASQGGVWSRREFERQLDWLREAGGESGIVSNKNHYTRFEGWGELYRWCEANGIAVDQTRGPSKGGNVGFLFGTCQPYYPIAWADEGNRLYHVLELGFLTQDLDIGRPWSDSSITPVLLERVQRVGGVAHFLFHQCHIESKPSVVQALASFVGQARERGLVFWTSREIEDWVRRRRAVRIAQQADGRYTLASEAELDGLIVWEPLAAGAAETESGDTAIRFGVHCRKLSYTVLIQGAGGGDE
ncbi:hypothetical protein PA598K_04658 [Paenibacillus sp. 598K]|uniref:hypothetical protein n=1 Tax=Paenibacillus sp. 598K TaxID=1117987 RepID=UPI000FF95CE0|nr:hypothetical protein [Paenibacillus sp. 598K]GBF76207.1 hypothetical protein PA598K_04658 [Paenibacillus sp. 598K]